MSLNLVKLTPEHFEEIKWMIPSVYHMQQYAEFLASNGIGLAGVMGGKVVGMGGVFPLWAGVAEAWTLLSEDVKKDHGFWLHKTVRSWLKDQAKDCGFHRIQINVDASDDRALKWAKVLGFDHEGIMRQYAFNKVDMVRMAMLF
jgi:RimJ/RimL family protein N-acetyltransferase